MFAHIRLSSRLLCSPSGWKWYWVFSASEWSWWVCEGRNGEDRVGLRPHFSAIPVHLRRLPESLPVKTHSTCHSPKASPELEVLTEETAAHDHCNCSGCGLWWWWMAENNGRIKKHVRCETNWSRVNLPLLQPTPSLLPRQQQQQH